MSYTSIIQSRDLAENLSNPDWRIFDCRFELGDVEAGQDAYDCLHITGATYVNLDSDLSAPVEAGVTGRHPLPDEATVAELFCRLGIDASTQVVVYDGQVGMMAARLWWMLRWLGHEKVAVLDGGWRKWHSEKNPVESDIKTFEKKVFTSNRQNHLRASVEQVSEYSLNQSKRLLDARPADRFRGENETLDLKAGHIPNAVSAPFMDNVDKLGCLLEPAILRENYRELLNGVETGDTIVYCGSGVTAAHDILALQHAGLGSAKLYVGSWSHWITDDDRPIADK